MSLMNRTWLRETIANNDTFTAMELIIARHQRVLANKKLKWKKKKKKKKETK